MSLMLRKEKAGKEAQKTTRRLELVEFRVEDDDITLLSGPYSGKTVKQLWPLGPTERDYIVQKIWFSGDEEAVRVVNGLCAD